MRQSRSIWISGATMLALVAVAGCASGEPPNAQLGAARSAISDAERSGAAERAPVALNSAREKLSRAEAATRQEEYDQARRLAEQAQIDAQLANTQAQSSAADMALKQVREGTATLGTETRRPAQ